MSKFNLDECGVCSAWNPDVKCANTGKILKLTITKCVNDQKNTYLLDSTGLEEGCNVIDEPVELEKAEMEQYLNNNFQLISGFDCEPFDPNRNICPTCNDRIEPGLEIC